MTRRKRIATATGLVLAGFASVVPAVLAVPGTSATVRFGNDTVGSSFPPITEHDNSGNGKFNLVPRTATIERGGTVEYDILVAFGRHQPAVYAPGTTPEDIQVLGPMNNVNDPTGRIALGDAVAASAPGVPTTGSWTTPALTTPGRYLVLCNFAPHFAEFNMYGWIEVK